MKQYISFSYNEEYLPTPRCKKLRVREVKSSTSVNIRECSKEDAPVVMVVKSYDCEECEIRVFKGKLYRNAQWRDIKRTDYPLEQNETVNTMNWQYAIWGHDYYNDCRWSGEIGDGMSMRTFSSCPSLQSTSHPSEVMVVARTSKGQMVCTPVRLSVTAK